MNKIIIVLESFIKYTRDGNAMCIHQRIIIKCISFH